MVNVRFILRQKNAEGLQPIYITARFGRNEKLMYSTSIKAEAIFWDEGRQRVKNSIYCSYADAVNDAISELSSKIDKFMMDAVKDGGSVTKESLKDFLDIHFGKKKRIDDFHGFFESYIAECDYRTNPKKGGQKLAYKTKREYARTYYYICEYEKARRVIITFDKVTQGMITDWVGFMQTLNRSANTIAHKVMTLKAVMRAAVERGLTDNTRWQFYRNSTEDTEAVALNEEELERLRVLDLSECPRLEKVRDLFLVGCWTGLRFSDVTRIKEEYIKDGMITIRQQKTGNYVTIPVHPVFAEIWEKYGGSLPTAISNQKFNVYIKEVCRMAGLDEPFVKSMTRGGRMEMTKYAKWEVVSSHTARRSFATNLYKSGFPSISIMQITGHRTEAAFLKYIKVSKHEHAKLLAEHWREINESRNDKDNKNEK